MPLSDIVSISITTQAVLPVQAGFGEPLILAADCPVGFTGLVQHFNSGPTGLAALVTLGFATTSATYLAAAAVSAQSPQPPTFAVGKLTTLPTKHFTITPVSVNGYVYSFSFGTGAVYTATTATGGTTLALTCTAIAAAITALAVAGITAASTGTTVTISQATAGVWNRIGSTDANLTIVEDGADPGITANLTAITAYDSTWYALNSDNWASSALLVSIAAFAEANQKIHLSQTIDTGCANNVLSSGTDVMQTFKASAYTRSTLIYSQDSGNYTGIAWLAARLPKQPGSENWMFTILAGPVPSVLTATQQVNLKAKFGNYYYTVGGLNITVFGYTAAGSWLDLVRGRDWLTSRLQTRIFTILATTGNKIPYTDQGIAQVEGEVRAMMQEAIDAGFLASTPAPIITVPTAASATTTNRQNRILTPVTFQAQSAGAINFVTITGVVLL